MVPEPSPVKRNRPIALRCMANGNAAKYADVQAALAANVGTLAALIKSGEGIRNTDSNTPVLTV